MQTDNSFYDGKRFYDSVEEIFKERDQLRAELARTQKHVQCCQCNAIWGVADRLLCPTCAEGIRAELERVKTDCQRLGGECVKWEEANKVLTDNLWASGRVNDDLRHKNIVMREELEQAKRREAAMREALSDLSCEIQCYHDYNVHGSCCGNCRGLTDAVDAAGKALSHNAGHDYLSREQVEPLVEALRNAHTIRGSVDNGLNHAKQLGL